MSNYNIRPDLSWFSHLIKQWVPIPTKYQTGGKGAKSREEQDKYLSPIALEGEA